MNCKLLRTITVLSFAGMSLCFSLPAQEPGSMTAHVPFSFEAGGTRLAAGDYRIVQRDHYLVIQSDLRQKALVFVHPVQRSANFERSYLVFHKIGNSYFLAKSWLAGSFYGGDVAPSKHEREMAKSATRDMVAEVRVPVN